MEAALKWKGKAVESVPEFGLMLTLPAEYRNVAYYEMCIRDSFRSLAWSAALLLCPARTDIGYTPVSSLHFSLPCPHSTHGTRIPGRCV